MKRFLLLGLCGLSLSCVHSEPPEREVEVRTIREVSPYANLSDRELERHYLRIIRELQSLNGEMEEANAARDYRTVNSKARDGLLKAREAERIARNLDDPERRADRLEGTRRSIERLNKLIEITGQEP